jgi:hypothetical protein
MPIIFSTVSQFVEQVGRRNAWKYAELDVMMCIFTGPAAGALAFKPKVNDVHPQYPLMFCTDSGVTFQAAGIAEVQATYAGIIRTSGQSPYYTDPVVTVTPTQGSRDFVRAWSMVTSYDQIDVMGDGSIIETIPKFSGGTQTTTVRYVGTQCQVRYQAYPKPAPYHYSSVGLGYVKWNILSETIGPQLVSYQNVDFKSMNEAMNSVPAIPPLYAAKLGWAAQQRGKWFTVTENYGPTF